MALLLLFRPVGMMGANVMVFKKYRKIKRQLIREFSSARFMWIANLFLVVGLLNACADSFTAKDCSSGPDCEASASESAGAASGSESESGPGTSTWGGGTTYGSGGSSGTSGSSMSTSTYGGGSNNGTSTSASTGTGGASVSTSSGGGSQNTTSNNDYSFNMPLTIMSEPMDINVEETDVFSLIFIAYGKRPITYKWFKKGNATPLGSGEGQTIYYNTGAKMSDGGIYYAEVTDANGDTLKSRETRVNVKEGRKPCEAGDYVPANANYWQQGAFGGLITKQQAMASGNYQTYYQNINLGKTKDAYIVNVDCSFKQSFTGQIACSVESSMRYQCRNGSYALVVDTCICQPDYGD